MISRDQSTQTAQNPKDRGKHGQKSDGWEWIVVYSGSVAEVLDWNLFGNTIGDTMEEICSHHKMKPWIEPLSVGFREGFLGAGVRPSNLSLNSGRGKAIK